MEEEIGKLSIEMDSNSLFKETVYTDRKSGSIKMLEKINLQTNTVASDEKLFIGETQIMTPMGALPINFEIPAKTINDAVGANITALKVAYIKRSWHAIGSIIKSSKLDLSNPALDTVKVIGQQCIEVCHQRIDFYS